MSKKNKGKQPPQKKSLTDGLKPLLIIEATTKLPYLLDTLYDIKEGWQLEQYRDNNSVHRIMAQNHFDVQRWLSSPPLVRPDNVVPVERPITYGKSLIETVRESLMLDQHGAVNLHQPGWKKYVFASMRGRDYIVYAPNEREAWNILKPLLNEWGQMYRVLDNYRNRCALNEQDFKILDHSQGPVYKEVSLDWIPTTDG
jgi:hypothetical protein